MSAKLAVAPLSLIVELPPGKSTTETISLHNTGEEPAQINLKLMDWGRTPSGSLQIKNPGALERSCADWILYSPTSLSLEPGERRDVTVELAVPEDTSGDHWALILASEETQSVEEDQPVTTRISVSYAIKILQKDPQNRIKSAKITDIELEKSSPLKLSVSFRNDGIAHLQTTGRVEIRDLQGETIKEFEIGKFPTLPGEKHIINVGGDEIESNLEPGQYYAIATMDFGGDRLIQGGLPIEIPESEGE
ncbi:hypothetical protein K9M06_06085 [Candidatus Bipolaricaulota bacterium]|nr:hypothetical protein [Candidatus Bipolaricaulota bacterium]